MPAPHRLTIDPIALEIRPGVLGVSVADLEEVLTILELHRQGLTIPAIDARLSMDRKTIRKSIKDDIQSPRYGPRAPRPCVSTRSSAM
jgi:hypothetical protein